MANATTPVIQINEGNVGIGTTTPGAKLQIGSATYAPNGNLSNNLLQIKSPSGFAYLTIGNSDTANSTAYIGGASGLLVLGSVTDAGVISEHIRMTSAGNIGIGTTSPAAHLQVERTSGVTFALSASSSITSGNRGDLAWYNSDVSTVGMIRALAVTDNVGTELQFHTRPAGGSLTETFTLESDGSATFVGLVSGITPTAAANFTTKDYVDDTTAGYRNLTFVDGTELTERSNSVPTPNRTSNPDPQDYDRVFSTEFKNSASIGSPVGNAWAGLISMAPYAVGAAGSFKTTQLAFAASGSNTDLYIRQGSTTLWGSWSKILTETNSGTGPFLPLAGGTMTGVTQFNDHTDYGDQVYARFGASQDLQIYHDGSNSYIKDTGTGRLIIKSDYFEIDNAAGTEAMLEAIQDGAVNLYYNGVKTFETTSQGATITSAATYALKIANTDAYNSGESGGIVFNGKYNAGGSTTDMASITGGKENSVDGDFGGKLSFNTRPNGGSDTERMRIDSAGNIVSNPSGGVITLGANGHITSKQSLDVATAGGRLIGASNRGTVAQIQLEQQVTSADGGMIKLATAPSGSTSTTIRMLIDMAGNVGIGTTAPAKPLHVIGEARFDNDVTIQPTRKLYLDGGNDTYITEVAANDIAFNTGGSEKMRITSAGNVGIGTTSPSAALDVQGSSALFMTRTSSGLATYVENDGGYAAQYWYAIGGGSKIGLHTNGASYFNGGNVGIGTTTPQTKLEVDGTSSAFNAHFGQGQHNSSGVWGGISLGYAEANTSYRKVGIVAKALGDGAARQDLNFLVDIVNDSNSATIADSKMMIDGLTGNVGIGHGFSDPGSILHIAGASPEVRIATTADGETARLGLYEDTAGFNHGGYIQYVGNGDTLRLGLVNGNVDIDVLTMTDTGVATFAENVFCSRTLAIGATSITSGVGLEVVGKQLLRTSNGVADLYLGNYAVDNYFRFHTNNSNTYFDAHCGDVYWRNTSDYIKMTFDVANGDMDIDGTLTQGSDIRRKENIVEIGDCIGKVQAMRGVYYNRNDKNTEVTKVGVIAQEVEAVLPELIRESPEDGFKSVAYSELTAVLINAVKEQQEIIEDLKTRIEQLEN